MSSDIKTPLAPPNAQKGAPLHRPMKVLAVGLPRTGTYSLALALRQLGFQDVYHLLDWGFVRPEDWRVFGDAADALFPTLSTYTGRGMTRQDWDVVFGPCEATTDIAGVFAPSLIETFPEAQVILGERDLQPWLDSILRLLDMVFGRWAWVSKNITEPIVGEGNTKDVQKVLRGWLALKGTTKEELERKAREMYDWHGTRVAEMVPRERLLRFRVDQGWGPLCEFLGKEVPDVPFPHENDAASLTVRVRERRLTSLRKAGRRIGWWFLVVMAVLIGIGTIWTRGEVLA